MKTIEQIINDYKSETLDGRDLNRLVDFLTAEECKSMGIEFKEGYTHERKKEFNKENILVQLKEDVEFGFEKALNRRGISSSLMAEVVVMWLWVLDVQTEHGYAQYGLPIFKYAAMTYGFENPIGDMEGDEYIFSSESEEWFDC